MSIVEIYPVFRRTAAVYLIRMNQTPIQTMNVVPAVTRQTSNQVFKVVLYKYSLNVLD